MFFGLRNVSPTMSIRENLHLPIRCFNNVALCRWLLSGDGVLQQGSHGDVGYSEGQVCHSKEFYIGSLLCHERMSIPEDVHWVRRGELRMPIIRVVQEHQIRCVIQDDYHWICLTIHQLCQQECACTRDITKGIFCVDIRQRFVMLDAFPRWELSLH